MKNGTEVGQLTTGDCFGEQALMYSRPRAATIKCATDCHFGILNKDDYELTFTKI